MIFFLFFLSLFTRICNLLIFLPYSWQFLAPFCFSSKFFFAVKLPFYWWHWFGPLTGAIICFKIENIIFFFFYFLMYFSFLFFFRSSFPFFFLNLLILFRARTRTCSCPYTHTPVHRHTHAHTRRKHSDTLFFSPPLPPISHCFLFHLCPFLSC